MKSSQKALPTMRTISNLMSLLQYGLLIAALLILILFASNLYRKITDNRQGNYESRAQLAYLVNQIKGADQAGKIEVRQTENGAVLVLTEVTPAGSYETRYYLASGYLMEEYAAAEKPIHSEMANRIGQTDELAIDLDENLLTIQTETGAASIALHTSCQK